MAAIREAPARHWVFTLNGDKKVLEDTYTKWQDQKAFGDILDYLIVGKETGAGGTFHLQGYLTLKKKNRRSWVKANFCNEAHYEQRRGTHAQARDYIKNNPDKPDAVYFEWGAVDQPEERARTDLTSLAATIKTTRSFRTILDDHGGKYIQYGRNMQNLHAYYHRPRPRATPEVYYITGASGIGKTYTMFKIIEHEGWDYHTVTETATGWMDGYEDQDTIYFEDFIGTFPRTLLLRLVDRQPIQLQVKGGWRPISAHRFIFTSNKELTTIYDEDPGGAWGRRIKEFGTKVEPRLPPWEPEDGWRPPEDRGRILEREEDEIIPPTPEDRGSPPPEDNIQPRRLGGPRRVRAPPVDSDDEKEQQQEQSVEQRREEMRLWGLQRSNADRESMERMLAAARGGIEPEP